MKIFPYDMNTFLVLSSIFGIIVFPLAFLTLFYYLMIYGISMVIFGEMNFYLHGILAGGTGAIWGYFFQIGFQKMDEINKNKKKFSSQECKTLLRRNNRIMVPFIIFDFLFILGIKYFHLY